MKIKSIILIPLAIAVAQVAAVPLGLNSELDASGQKILPTDIYKPIQPAAEQDGVKFHNIDVVSFLPGVVDETWIVAFGGT